MEIPEIIRKVSWSAIEHYGDSATIEYYKRLKKRQFSTTKCRACKELWFPPRVFCPLCLSEDIEWVDLPGKGRLYAFTQQHRALRFRTPDVIGLVEIEGVGKILTKIDGRLEDLRIGMELELDFIDITDEITLHQFRPVKSNYPP